MLEKDIVGLFEQWVGGIFGLLFCRRYKLPVYKSTKVASRDGLVVVGFDDGNDLMIARIKDKGNSCSILLECARFPNSSVAMLSKDITDSKFTYLDKKKQITNPEPKQRSGGAD